MPSPLSAPQSQPVPAALPVTRPQAVLWDMDGTLVDTEPYWIAAEHELVDAHGGTWTHEDALSLVGNPLTTSAQILRDRGGVDLPVEEIVRFLVGRVAEQVRTRVPWQPGARELLATLRDAGVPCALVTMSYRELAQPVADLAGGAFDVLVCGDEVERGKPDPEPYLTAAARLGVDVAACVAIEDSPAGIASALASGAATLGVEAVVPVLPAPGLSRTPSLELVDLELLARLVAGDVVDLMPDGAPAVAEPAARS